MKTKHFYIFFLCILIETVFLYSCKTTSQLVTEENLPEGFQIFQGTTPDKSVTWHCVKIDLNTPDLQLEILPDHQDYELFSLKQIARQHNAILAVNTTPFALEKKSTIVGVTKTKNKTISLPNERYAALCFTTNPLRAHIINSQTEETLINYPYAAGGFWTIIDDGKILPFEKYKHFRTAAGISEEGRYLFIFAATPKFSITDEDGMTFEECAEIMLELGCTNALQLDGGHSTGLYFNGKELEKTFLQRKVPACLIIK